MKFEKKDIIHLSLIAILAFFGYRMWSSLHEDLAQARIDYKNISDTLARAENQMVTKTELANWAKAHDISLKEIRDDLNSIDGKLEAVGETIATIEGKIDSDQSSDSSTDTGIPDQPDECKLCDIHGYTSRKETKNFTLGNMPAGKCEFEASKKNPWTITQDQIDISIKTTLGSTKDGLYIFHHEVGLLNKSRPELDGKIFKLKIVSSEFRQTNKTTKDFFWWAPTLDLSLDNQISFGTIIEYKVGVSLGFSFLAYGYSKKDTEWRFARLGLGIDTDKEIFISLEPVRYNIGKLIPIIDDLWLGVNGIYNGDWGIGITLGTNL